MGNNSNNLTPAQMLRKSLDRGQDPYNGAIPDPAPAPGLLDRAHSLFFGDKQAQLPSPSPDAPVTPQPVVQKPQVQVVPSSDGPTALQQAQQSVDKSVLGYSPEDLEKLKALQEMQNR